MMECSLCISFFIIQDGKTIKGNDIFEIKTEQNHTSKSLFDVFSELRYRHYSVWKQTKSALIS